MNFICRYYAKWLIPFANGSLEERSPGLAAQVARHIELCPKCSVEAQRLSGADRSLRKHVQSASSTWEDGARTTSALASRVRSLIEPEQRAIRANPWSPGAASFAGAAMLAVVMVALIIPQSYARIWFASRFLNHRSPAPSVNVAVKPPYPAADPFRAPLSPRLAAPPAESPQVAPRLPAVSIAHYRDPSTDAASADASFKQPVSHKRDPQPAASGQSPASRLPADVASPVVESPKPPQPDASAATPIAKPASTGAAGEDPAMSQSPPPPPADLNPTQPGVVAPANAAPPSAPEPVVKPAQSPSASADRAQSARDPEPSTPAEKPSAPAAGR